MKVTLELTFMIVLISLSLLIAGIRYHLARTGYSLEDFANTIPLKIAVPIAVFVAWGPLIVASIALLIWYCFRRRHILTRGFQAVLREVALLVVLLFIAVIVGLFSGVPVVIVELAKRLEVNPAHLQLILVSFLTVFPICVSLYLWCTFRSATRNRVRFASLGNRPDHGQQTAPLSTRVSLPSDTAEHAPNFLSPSTAEPTEETPLL